MTRDPYWPVAAPEAAPGGVGNPPFNQKPIAQAAGAGEEPRATGVLTAATPDEALGKMIRAQAVDAGRGASLNSVKPQPAQAQSHDFANDLKPEFQGTEIGALAAAIAKDLSGLVALSRQPESHNQEMSMTREELEAHLKAQSAQTETALAKQNGAIDARLADFGARIDQAIGEMRRDRAEIKAEIGELRGDMRAEIGGLRGDMKGFRLHIVSTVVVTGIAVVLGIAAFNATVLSNMVASFESGKNTAQAVSDATKRLEALQDRIEAQQKRESTSAPPK